MRRCDVCAKPKVTEKYHFIRWTALQKHRWPFSLSICFCIKGPPEFFGRRIALLPSPPPFAETRRELNRSFRADRDINLDLVTFNAYLLDQREADDRGVNLLPNLNACAKTQACSPMVPLLKHMLWCHVLEGVRPRIGIQIYTLYLSLSNLRMLRWW